MIDPLLIPVPESLDTERLRITVPRPGDGQILFDAITETLEDLRRFPASLPWAQSAPSVQSSEAYCRSSYANFIARKDLPYLLLDRSSGTLVGCCGLHLMNWAVPKFEIGFWCRSSMQAKGFITEAVRGLTSMAFDQLDAQRVEIFTDDANTRSWRVCERAGFSLEGTLRNERRAPDGSLRHTRVYARLAVLNQESAPR
jgi:hypothetical protein